MNDLAARQDEMKARMMRHERLRQLAYQGLEDVLQPQPAASLDQQIKIAASVAIPTLKGIGDFAPDQASANILIGLPPPSILERWSAEAIATLAQEADPPTDPPALPPIR